MPQAKIGKVRAKAKNITLTKGKTVPISKPVTVAPSVPKKYRGMVAGVLKYRELRAQGKINKIDAMEKASKLVGKKGQILKRETRYKTGEKKLKEAKEAVKKISGPGKRPSKKAFIEYHRQMTEREKKAAQSYAQKRIPDRRFKKVAREKAAKFGKMIDVFASETYNKLRDGAYGVGSDLVEKLLDEGLSPEDIEKYLKQIMETFNDIPAEARTMASNDDFWQAVIDLSQTIGNNDILNTPDVFNAYLTTDPDNREYFTQALENYALIDDNSKSFSEVWEELQHTMDPGSIENMEEILEGDE